MREIVLYWSLLAYHSFWSQKKGGKKSEIHYQLQESAVCWSDAVEVTWKWVNI